MPAAQAQIRAAIAWWKVNRQSAPDAVDEAIERAFASLRVHPHAGVPLDDARRPNVRRIHLRRIHYFLYFRVSGETIEIVAFWHTSRGSGPPL